MGMQPPGPPAKTNSRFRKILEWTGMVILLLIAVEAGFVFWYQHTATPVREFCDTVAVNDDFTAVRDRADKLELDSRELLPPAGDEKIIIFSKPPNGESQCQVQVRDGRVSRKQYHLYLI